MGKDRDIHDAKSKRYKAMKDRHGERRKEQREKAKTKKK